MAVNHYSDGLLGSSRTCSKIPLYLYLTLAA